MTVPRPAMIRQKRFAARGDEARPLRVVVAVDYSEVLRGQAQHVARDDVVASTRLTNLSKISGSDSCGLLLQRIAQVVRPHPKTVERGSHHKRGCDRGSA